ncbi:glycosyltransferase [Halalkalibaculum sp. DA3122]|uniref:glycosyltransferase n=1 Tax=Halalkalibaculum sp. DA3122 TaxID=3373607 RepID=UPI003754BA95
MRVLFQSRKTLFSAPGGDTTQILKTKEHLEKLGIEVNISLELTPDLSDYDIVHVFNLMRPQDLYLQVKNAKEQNKKIALSTIYGPYEEYEKKGRGGFLQILNKTLSITQIEYLKVVARAVLNNEFSKGTLLYLINGHTKLQKKILKYTDVLLPNSESEMERVINDFNLNGYTYNSVPNAVDINKFKYEEVEVPSDIEKYRDCVLCVSRIEGRKNQLNVVRAAKALPYKFVFIGKAGANFKNYMQKCIQESPANCEFIGPVAHEDLPKYYKVSRVHILASWMETPGLTSLEAAIMKNNIVVTKKGDTESYFGDMAYYCEPDSVESIKKAIVCAYKEPFKLKLTKKIVNNYTWEDTAQETLKGYKKII